MRITQHPVLGELDKKQPMVTIWFNNKPIEARLGEPIAAALMASGVHVFRKTHKLGEPRGIYCGIGRCTDCAMIVDGIPNTRTCVTPVKDGMKVETQFGLGNWRDKSEK